MSSRYAQVVFIRAMDKKIFTFGVSSFLKLCIALQTVCELNYSIKDIKKEMKELNYPTMISTKVGDNGGTVFISYEQSENNKKNNDLDVIHCIENNPANIWFSMTNKYEQKLLDYPTFEEGDIIGKIEYYTSEKKSDGVKMTYKIVNIEDKESDEEDKESDEKSDGEDKENEESDKKYPFRIGERLGSFKYIPDEPNYFSDEKEESIPVIMTNVRLDCIEGIEDEYVLQMWAKTLGIVKYKKNSKYLIKKIKDREDRETCIFDIVAYKGFGYRKERK